MKRKVEKRLDNLYESIPVTIKCKGLCVESCGPIAMTGDEFRRISEASNSEPTVDSKGTCSLLVGGKCSVYSVRPLICRLFGLIKKMNCPYGCVPEPRWMTNEESYQLLRKIDKITGRKPDKATMPGLAEVLNEKKTGR